MTFPNEAPQVWDGAACSTPRAKRGNLSRPFLLVSQHVTHPWCLRHTTPCCTGVTPDACTRLQTIFSISRSTRHADSPAAVPQTSDFPAVFWCERRLAVPVWRSDSALSQSNDGARWRCHLLFAPHPLFSASRRRTRLPRRRRRLPVTHRRLPRSNHIKCATTAHARSSAPSVTLQSF